MANMSRSFVVCAARRKLVQINQVKLNTIAHQFELFGSHLEPSKTLARKVKNHHNDLQKQSPARENRTDLERWRELENQILACGLCLHDWVRFFSMRKL